MKLVPAGDIRTTLGFDDMPDINDAIDTALHMATQILARFLDTDFNVQSVEDVFYVPPYLKPERDGFTHTVLRLSRGFVAGTPVVEGSYTPHFGDTVIVETMRCESAEAREKGIMKDYQTSYVAGNLNRLMIAQGPYIRVRYGSGFLTDPLEDDLYLQAQVPAWLRELAKMQALMLLTTNPIVVQAQIQQPVEALQKTFTSIMNRHVRFHSSALVPLFSREGLSN